MKAAAVDRLQPLRSDHPEWSPWLHVVDVVLKETLSGHWERFVPSLSCQMPERPLLANTRLVFPREFLESWGYRLFDCAAQSGTAPLGTLKNIARAQQPAVELFRIAICQDFRKLQDLAGRFDAEIESLRAVSALLPIPFLQACKGQASPSVEEIWAHGYCPLCGAWPAFAEVRGIERTRYLRCGRCGSEWAQHCLHCPFCGSENHQQLISLVPHDGTTSRTIDACKNCAGYVKSLAVLQGADHLGVMLADLASVDLDIAAVEQNFRRPDGPGFPLGMNIEENRAFGADFFPWRSC